MSTPTPEPHQPIATPSPEPTPPQPRTPLHVPDEENELIEKPEGDAGAKTEPENPGP